MRFLFPALHGSTIETLPYELSNGRALICRDSEIEQSPFPLMADFPTLRSEDSIIRFQVSLDLTTSIPRGTFEGKWECPSEAFFLDRLSRDRVEEACEELRETVLPDWGEETVWDESLEFGGCRFTYACSLAAERLVEHAGEMCIVDVAQLAPERRGYDEEVRRSSIELLYPRRVQCVVDILPPQGMYLESAGSIGSTTEPFGEFQVQVTESEGRVRHRSEMVLKQSSIKPSKYPRLKRFFADWGMAISEKLVFVTATGEQ